MTAAFALTHVALGFTGAIVAGMLGVGGAIVMIPLLLYVPPLLGMDALDVKSVTGVTMVQVFFAAIAGTVAHRRHRAVQGQLAWIGGVAKTIGTLAGAIASAFLSDVVLLAVFALMAMAAAVLMFLPLDTALDPPGADHVAFDPFRVIVVSAGVGVAAGLVGAGGSFLLVPLLLFVVGVPIRVAIGSSLAITAVAAFAGVAGKVVTAQVPLGPSIAVALGALPGALLGGWLSRRMSGSHLKRALGLVVVVTAIRVWIDLVGRLLR